MRPERDACSVRSQDADVLFPGARHGQAALAGLLLRVGCWPESHEVSQDIQSAEGSYWHAIVHRMEPDSSNAAYWFRRVGQHAIFPELFRLAAEILKNGGPKHWRPKATWDPFLFIDWCDEAREKGGEARPPQSKFRWLNGNCFLIGALPHEISQKHPTAGASEWHFLQDRRRSARSNGCSWSGPGIGRK